MKGRFKRFIRSQGGIAYLEFGLLLPILMILFTGAYEYSRFILLSQRLEKLAFSTALIVAQSTQLTETQSEVTGLFNAGDKLMEPFIFNPKGRMYVSFILHDATYGSRIAWQDSKGTLAVSSAIGSQGNAANLPSGITVAQGKGLVITEVHYDYEPLWFSFVSGTNETQRMSYQTVLRTTMLAS